MAATAAALEHAPDGPVIGVGVTSMAETGVLLDRHGRPVAPAIAWHDARGEAEAARLAADLGAERFSARTGLPVRPLLSIAKYAWLRANHPEVAEAVRWLGVAEWVVHGLGGEQVAELSLASRTGLLDLERRAWWDEARDLGRGATGAAGRPGPGGQPGRPGRRRPPPPPGRGHPDRGRPRPPQRLGRGRRDPARRPVRLLRHRRGAHPGRPAPGRPRRRQPAGRGPRHRRLARPARPPRPARRLQGRARPAAVPRPARGRRPGPG